MSIEEDKYSDNAFIAYKTALRVIESLISRGDIDFKEIEDRKESYEKMKWIIFQDILSRYKR